MTEGIVPGAAEDGAAFPVVVLVADEAIRVLEVGAAAAVQVLGPLLAHRQVPLGGQAANEALGVFCGETRSMIRVPRAGRGMLRGGCLVGWGPQRWSEGGCVPPWQGGGSGEGSVGGKVPVVRSSGESVWRASMMSEKVPCRDKGQRQPATTA